MKFLRYLLTGCACLWVVVLVHPGRAADVSVTSLTDATLIHLSGPLEAGDEKRLVRALLDSVNPVVSFDSPGGSLLVGLSIGRAIRLQEATTIVEDGRTCASACGLAWLGGTRRLMGSTAQIGFHAAYFIDDAGNSIETGSGNALVGAYLSQIGMGDDAIYYITKSAPADMQWLTADDANALGIHVRLAGAPTPVPAQPQKTMERPTCHVADVRPPDAWLALRSEPGARIGRQLRRLLPGQPFEMLGDTHGNWHRVRLPDGLAGWVSWEVRRWIAC